MFLLLAILPLLFGNQSGPPPDLSAEVRVYDDHADTPELLDWLRTFKKQPEVTHLVHGEPDAASALKDAITKELHWNVDVAQYMQKVEVL